MTKEEILAWLMEEINSANAVDARRLAASPADVRSIEIFHHGQACGLTQALHMLDLMDD